MPAYTIAICSPANRSRWAIPTRWPTRFPTASSTPSWQQDPYARVACETLLTTGLVCLAGEITTKAMVDYPAIVRQIVREIGYTSSEMGFDATTCAVMVALGKQSPDIAQGVDEDTRQGQGHRRRRPGHDVRLRLQRDRPS